MRREKEDEEDEEEEEIDCETEEMLKEAIEKARGVVVSKDKVKGRTSGGFGVGLEEMVEMLRVRDEL
jgi:hypothetical protein